METNLLQVAEEKYTNAIRCLNKYSFLNIFKSIREENILKAINLMQQVCFTYTLLNDHIREEILYLEIANLYLEINRIYDAAINFENAGKTSNNINHIIVASELYFECQKKNNYIVSLNTILAHYIETEQQLNASKIASKLVEYYISTNDMHNTIYYKINAADLLIEHYSKNISNKNSNLIKQASEIYEDIGFTYLGYTEYCLCMCMLCYIVLKTSHKANVLYDKAIFLNKIFAESVESDLIYSLLKNEDLFKETFDKFCLVCKQQSKAQLFLIDYASIKIDGQYDCVSLDD